MHINESGGPGMPCDNARLKRRLNLCCVSGVIPPYTTTKAMSNPTSKPLPGFDSPAVGFEHPFEMLFACHERVRRSLSMLARVQSHVASRGVDAQARQAAADVLRYFRVAAPAHHEDEERHVVPVLQDSEDADLRAAADRILIDHAKIRGAWLELEPYLQNVGEGTAPPAQPFARAVENFGRVHDDHLRLEEETAFPGARRVHEALGEDTIAAIGREMESRRRGTRD